MSSQDDTGAAWLWQPLLLVLLAPVGGGDLWACATTGVAFVSVFWVRALLPLSPGV